MILQYISLARKAWHGLVKWILNSQYIINSRVSLVILVPTGVWATGKLSGESVSHLSHLTPSETFDTIGELTLPAPASRRCRTLMAFLELTVLSGIF